LQPHFHSRDQIYNVGQQGFKSNKNKKEVKNDLLSNMAPPIIQSCSTISFFYGLFIS